MRCNACGGEGARWAWWLSFMVPAGRLFLSREKSKSVALGTSQTSRQPGRLLCRCMPAWRWPMQSHLITVPRVRHVTARRNMSNLVNLAPCLESWGEV